MAIAPQAPEARAAIIISVKMAHIIEHAPMVLIAMENIQTVVTVMAQNIMAPAHTALILKLAQAGRIHQLVAMVPIAILAVVALMVLPVLMVHMVRVVPVALIVRRVVMVLIAILALRALNRKVLTATDIMVIQ